MITTDIPEKWHRRCAGLYECVTTTGTFTIMRTGTKWALYGPFGIWGNTDQMQAIASYKVAKRLAVTLTKISNEGLAGFRAKRIAEGKPAAEVDAMIARWSGRGE